MARVDEQPRTIEVRSLSLAAETAAVVRAVVLIVLVAAVVIGLEQGAAGPAGRAGRPAVSVTVDQIPFAALPSADQRLVVRIREGLAAAETERGRSGAWPTVEALAARSLPPFAD